MVEAVTWSFIAKPQAELFGGGQAELALANPIAADLSDMRPSLIPGLVASAQKNADRGFPDVALFEVGQIFRGDGAQDQFIAAAGRAPRAGLGERHRAALVGQRPRRDAFDVKADALAVLAAAGAPAQAMQVVPGGPTLAASGTLRHDPDRPAERARLFRRTASPRARSARRRGSADGVRGDPGAHPRGQGEADARQAGAGIVRRSSR